MCSFRSCQTRFEFLSQFRKVRNAFECFITQVQTRLPKTKCVWPMKINVICTVCFFFGVYLVSGVFCWFGSSASSWVGGFSSIFLHIYSFPLGWTCICCLCGYLLSLGCLVVLWWCWWCLIWLSCSAVMVLWLWFVSRHCLWGLLSVFLHCAASESPVSSSPFSPLHVSRFREGWPWFGSWGYQTLVCCLGWSRVGCWLWLCLLRWCWVRVLVGFPVHFWLSVTWWLSLAVQRPALRLSLSGGSHLLLGSSHLHSLWPDLSFWHIDGTCRWWCDCISLYQSLFPHSRSVVVNTSVI